MCLLAVPCTGFICYRGHGWCWMKNKYLKDQWYGKTVQLITEIARGLGLTERAYEGFPAIFAISPFWAKLKKMVAIHYWQYRHVNSCGSRQFLCAGINQSAQQCYQLCRDSPGCHSFTYRTYEWECWMSREGSSATLKYVIGDGITVSID